MGDWRCQEATAVFTSVWKRVTAMVEPAACVGGGDAVEGGRAIAFALAPGQAHELPLAPGLLDCLPDVPGWIVGDRGFASDAFRELIWSRAHREPGRASRHPALAYRRARRLPGVDLRQPPPRREPLGTAE